MKTTLNDDVLEKIENYFDILRINKNKETLNKLRLKLYEVVSVLYDLLHPSFTFDPVFNTYNITQIKQIKDIRDELMKNIEEISFELYRNKSFLDEIPPEYFPTPIKFTNNNIDILIQLYKKHDEICVKLHKHFFPVDRSSFWLLTDEKNKPFRSYT
jgi:hypothetical protein